MPQALFRRQGAAFGVEFDEAITPAKPQWTLANDVILFAKTWSQALGCKWTSGMAQPCLVMLLNPDRIWFGTVTSLNRTTLLPEGGAEAVVEHNFLVGLMAEED
ncbi:hypothetical protein STEG23_036393 [Scotinomys teguina]